MIEDSDEIYKRYFGGRSWKGFSGTGTSTVQLQNINSSRPIVHRSIGPSSDMLQPVVTVNMILQENKNILLAKGWKLGRWDRENKRAETNADTRSTGQHQTLLAVNQGRSSTKGVLSASRTMSVPDLSGIAVASKLVGDVEGESRNLLTNVFPNQQDGHFKTAMLLPPPDDKICKFRNS